MRRLRGWVALLRWRWGTRGMTVAQRDRVVLDWLDSLEEDR